VECADLLFGYHDFDAACTPDNCLFAHGFKLGRDDWGWHKDALSERWPTNFNIFCNPPYDQTRKFIERAIDQVCNVANMIGATFLIPANTDTKLWELISEYASCIVFLRPRIAFLNPETLQPGLACGHGSAFVRFTPKRQITHSQTVKFLNWEQFYQGIL